MQRRIPPLLMACWLAAALPVAAQVPHLEPPPERTDFLSSLHYHFSVQVLAVSDPQYRWDADFGGEFDVVGGPRGRLNVKFNYESVLSNQLQPFDPVQGNYDIELVGGGRAGELAYEVVFHHTSRHLGDRPKSFGIAWNLLGPQLTWTRPGERTSTWLNLRILKAVTNDFVDYTGELSVDGVWDRTLSPRLGLVGRGGVVSRTVESASPRDAQWGGRAELAFRVDGAVGRMEVFGGVERRMDANAFERRPVTWGLVGLRVIDR